METRRQSGVRSAAAVFFGSFLLFLLQPMLGRTLLPIFGGSAAVWSICLAAYQVLLLAGYFYAHVLASRPVRRQRRTHRRLLAGAALWALAVAACRHPLKLWLGASSWPACETIFGVLVFVGLPYVALAAGATLVQAWAAADGGWRGRRAPEAASDAPPGNVYRLYAVSNWGAFAGLLIYPFVLEPFVPLTLQWWGFAVCFAGYALGLSRLPFQSPTDSCVDGVDAPARPHGCSYSWLWLLLPAVSSFLLNAAVSHLFIDVTPVPLIWVAMLAAFLLSYVVGFSPIAERRRGGWCAAAGVALAGTAFADGMWGTGSFYPNAAAAFSVLFFAGVVLHGWLYETRPSPPDLTRYYLSIAGGGALGGLAASLAAPLVFSHVTEYPLGLCVCAVLVAWRLPKPGLIACSKCRARAFALCGGTAWALLALLTARHTGSQTLYRGRNFYGCLRVTQTFEKLGQTQAIPVHYLWCGQTTHGIQIRAPRFDRLATSYYGPVGGGIAFAAHPKYRTGAGMRVGVVGLGTGCLACYGRPVDLFRFYEINPDVVHVATDRNLFSFLPEATQPIDLVPGDARRMLEKERAAGDTRYDILVIDAYNGDAVPYHLATVEAYRLYFDRLAPDGILALHVSNWHIDMLPLCKAMARTLGAVPYGVVSPADGNLVSGAMWVFMTRKPMVYNYPGKSTVREVVWENVRDVPAPADERGSLLPLFRPVRFSVR